MHVERLTVPTGLAFNQRDLEDHLRVSGSETEFIYEVAQHARSAACELEHYAALALLDQTVRVTLDAWPRSSCFNLPIAPLIDWLTVTVTADSVPFDAFAVIAGLRPALRLTGDRPCGAIVIEYLAGFGADYTSLPPDIRLAILDQAAATFDIRGSDDRKANGMSAHMARIAARYRRVAI